MLSVARSVPSDEMDQERAVAVAVTVTDTVDGSEVSVTVATRPKMEHLEAAPEEEGPASPTSE